MKSMAPILSYREITRTLIRERAACDRHPHDLCAVVFDVASPPLVRALLSRIRQTDEVGWLGEQCLCTVLPYTSRDGARKFADDVVRGLPKPPNITIYSYPAQWLDETAGSPLHLDHLLEMPLPGWKRAIDIAVSAVGLVMVTPILLVIAGVIRLSSSGPALLRQRRVGRHGRVFTLWKFRTMHVNADEEIHEEHLKTLITSDRPMAKLDVTADHRIFPAGRVIRRCYLDEMPQLLNVLRGEMSLVGPRPCLPYEAAHYSRWHNRRFQSLPGMTGLWQVSGKNKTTFAEMIRYDIAYARRLSFALDMKIILKTVPAILVELAERLTGRGTQLRRSLNVRPIRKNT